MDVIIDDMDYTLFKRKVNDFIGFDLNSYKQKQMYRRLNSLIARLNVKTFADYFNLIKNDPSKLEEFKNFVTINVTEFFRNPEKFDDLIQFVLPELIKNSHNGLKIWSAGCSLGAEAYTLSIIMQENFRFVPYSIIATDIDEEILKKAKLGVYMENEIRNIPKHILNKYFTQNDKGGAIQENVKKNVTFKKNNLLQDIFERDFDLILCRNVVIYFTEETKNILYKKFYDSLKANGILFVGGTENILNSKELGFIVPKPFFYKKAK